jgi:hypothetical protein
MMNDGVKMNILKILMNTQFTPFAEFDSVSQTYVARLLLGGVSEHAKIGEYKDMVVLIDGTSKDPSTIEVFEQSGECIYRGYVTKDGLGIREVDAGGLRS